MWISFNNSLVGGSHVLLYRGVRSRDNIDPNWSDIASSRIHILLAITRLSPNQIPAFEFIGARNNAKVLMVANEVNRCDAGVDAGKS